jgi:endonuclease/exonuclease/phosphatase family metal-dependent hydrolase
MHRRKLFAFAVALCCTCGCAPGRRVALTTMEKAPCASARSVTWVGPSATDGTDDRRRLSAWCESVGPAVIIEAASAGSVVDVSQSGLILVTWNIHEGGGDLERLVEYLRRHRTDSDTSPAVVILLQEVARADERVPDELPSTVRAPGRIRPERAPSFDIAAVANNLDMSLAYVPSMRNGRGVESGRREDRGSAILSTLPLTDIIGIELPWVSQRRVAVMAKVVARRSGVPWSLRVISVHLDNRPSRSIQAAALARFAKTLPQGDGPLVIGGDLNTWFGPAEPAVRELDAVVPRITACGNRTTFRLGLRLDHLFSTLAPDTLRRCEIVHDFFGSDHRPTALHLFR